MRTKTERTAVAYQGRRTRGRSERVRASVLHHAFELLIEAGLEGFSIAEVASRSAVHETSIYRRWGTRQRLAAEACINFAEGAVPIPDTGSIIGDAIALADSIRKILDAPVGQAIVSLILSSDADREALRAAFWGERQRQSHKIIERAQERGEIGDSEIGRNFLELLIAPLFFRTILTADPLDQWPLDRIARELLKAA